MLGKLVARLKLYARQFRGSSLLMGSVYLMMATIIVAAFGFLFWVIVTRSYAPTTVGLTATLLSVSGLTSMISLAGFDTTFVRFLPLAERRNDYINSGLLIVALASGVLSLAFVMSLPFSSPSLANVLDRPLYQFGFVFFTIVTSLNTLTNSIFLAFKRSGDIFIISMLFSALKVALPLMITDGDVMTIFALVGFSQLAGLILSFIIMRVQLGYVFLPRIHIDILRVIKKYSFSVYGSSILNLLPPTLLPLLVVHQLGAESAAYYYMAFTIAGVLYTIAYASMQSAFAEGSHDEGAIAGHITKAVKLVASLLLPAVILTVTLSGILLLIFGQSYATVAGPLLQLFALGAVPVAVYSALGAIFKVTKNLRGVVAMNLVYATTILGISYLFVPRWGLIAVGWAWIVGNLAACGTGAVFLIKRAKKRGEYGEVTKAGQ